MSCLINNKKIFGVDRKSLLSLISLDVKIANIKVKVADDLPKWPMFPNMAVLNAIFS